MKNMFQKITTTKYKPLSQGQKVQKLMTEIGGGWYMGEITKGLSTLRRPKLSKNSQEKIVKIIFKNYMKLIGIGMIRNSNYIVTSLSASIQEVNTKENNPIQFL